MVMMMGLRPSEHTTDRAGGLRGSGVGLLGLIQLLDGFAEGFLAGWASVGSGLHYGFALVVAEG